jgi:hypothetical protein
MIKIPELQKYSDRYTTMQFEPLRVIVTLKQAAIFYDPQYLDGLLARSVLDAACGYAILENTPEPYEFPLPFKRLWTAENGCPLWAAGVFLPDGKTITDTVYLHKRLGRLEFSEKQPKSNVGRWMDRRIPYKTHQTETARWYAVCFGNADEIENLLTNIRFIGKRRDIGFGEVASWEVLPWNGCELDTLVQAGRLIHAIPCDYPGISGVDAPALVGWTPPQWKPSLFSLGWRVGTPVNT